MQGVNNPRTDLYIFTVTPNRENFPKKWDFQAIFINKERHFCHFLAQNWGILAADYEEHGRIYHLPEIKLVPIDVELFTGNVFCIFSSCFLRFSLNFTNFFHIFQTFLDRFDFVYIFAEILQRLVLTGALSQKGIP